MRLLLSIANRCFGCAHFTRGIAPYSSLSTAEKDRGCSGLHWMGTRASVNSAWTLSVDPLRTVCVLPEGQKANDGPSSSSEFAFVSDAEDVDKCVSMFINDNIVGVDTEFNSFPVYGEQLQLIQLGGKTGSACIDAQTLPTESLHQVVSDLFSDKTIVLHSYSTDLKLLRNAVLKNGWNPGGIFDTQIAANIAGVGNSISLANLIELELGVKLDKSQSLTDWRLRPLTEAQLNYAMDDINYLLPLFESLSETLLKKGREEWMTEDMDVILNSGESAIADEEKWLGLRRLGQLRGAHNASKCIAMRLTAWRERSARERGVDPNIILKDDTILSISKGKSSSLEFLQTLQGIKWSVVYYNIEDLQLHINKGLQDDADGKVCSLPAHIDLSPREQYVADVRGTRVLGRIAEICEREDVAISALCPWEERFLLGACAIGKYNANDLSIGKGWRRELVGNSMNDLLPDLN
eukprot:m.86291 g.86291  ORF g.86291 m.86291 type:complete len:465 (-) comp12211_c0_seq1:22-1416(-)